jgi:hypothetical protein
MIGDVEQIPSDALCNSPTAEALRPYSIERRLGLLPETGTPTVPGGGPERAVATGGLRGERAGKNRRPAPRLRNKD